MNFTYLNNLMKNFDATQPLKSYLWQCSQLENIGSHQDLAERVLIWMLKLSESDLIYASFHSLPYSNKDFFVPSKEEAHFLPNSSKATCLDE